MSFERAFLLSSSAGVFGVAIAALGLLGCPTHSSVKVDSGWVRVAPGSFQMGSPSGEAIYRDETSHRVRLTRAFLMKRTEVTQGEYKSLMGDNPSVWQSCGDDCPVERVSWFDAVRYVNALSRKEGLRVCYRLDGESVTFEGMGCPGYRLPTEAEWEYAARASTTTVVYTGALHILGRRNGPELDPIAWYGGNSGASYAGAYDCGHWIEMQHSASTCGTHPVKGKQPNAWGLHDMLGNVNEWCHDWYGAYAAGPGQDPTGPSDAELEAAEYEPRGPQRVIRGGAWSDYVVDVRVPNRAKWGPSISLGDVGFRPVRSIP